MKKIIFAIFSLILLVFLASCDTRVVPTTLSAPTITISENVVSWEEVEHADSYIVNLNGTALEAQTTTNYTISATEAGEYTVKVKAISKNHDMYIDSDYSNSVTYSISKKEPIALSIPTISLKDNIVSWEKVDYADTYIVNLNGTDLEAQTAKEYTITASEAGEYVVKVKAISSDHNIYLDSDYSLTVIYIISKKEPIALSIPTISLKENIVFWEEVENADGYIVNFNGIDLEAQTAKEYTISASEAGEYVIKVKAISSDHTAYLDSDYSVTVTYTISKKEPIALSIPAISLKENIVSWEEVENADGYVVKFNGTALEVQTEASYTIEAKEDGDYEVEVKAISYQSDLYLDSEFSDVVIYHYEAPFEKVPATLFVVGDSTLASFSDSYYYPRYGYGTQLSNYFDEAIKVNNLALSGRSSKSFITETNYKTLKNSLKAGDYLLIGFGHNDEKSDDKDRFTDASKPLTDSNSFAYSLYEYYIKLALDKGATPILCTPIVRADKNNTYTGSNGHVTSTGDYAQAIVELGQEKNVTVINLRDLTKAKYSSIGYNEAIYYHAMTSGKKEESDIVVDTNSVDTTHLNIFGAKYVAYLVASELKKTTNILGKYVLEDIKEPTKDKDLVMNPNYKFIDYTSPNLASYQAPAQFKTTSEGWYGTAFGDCGGDPSASVNGYRA
ncbi:MAG: hypothetical protein K2J93_04480, partial [Anaeroplasmataceae bacterium]|nr:hypothetical protein [Anaeroplasmataceae bacterium]